MELVNILKEHAKKYPRMLLCDAVKQYKKDGYPMVSHSSVYQETYKPAYRVLLRK